MIRWLRSLRKRNKRSVGNKAANLGELMAAGFNVADGFVVTDPHLFYFDSVPAYSQLGGSKVAVRSSSMAEDGNGASFAGMYDTYLNVPSELEMNLAVEKVFNSINNPAAKEYAAANGIRNTRMAVIVQKMIPAEYSGVIFTVEPINGDEDTMCIEIVKGLGDKLVSGEVTPKSYLVDKREPFEVVDMTTDSVMIPDLIYHLAGVGLNIEKHFDAPQNIEFCTTNDLIWACQSRPITT